MNLEALEAMETQSKNNQNTFFFPFLSDPKEDEEEEGLVGIYTKFKAFESEWETTDRDWLGHMILTHSLPPIYSCSFLFFLTFFYF